VISYKDLQTLSGYSYLVNELDEVIDDVNKGNFVMTQINEDMLKKYKGGVVRILIIIIS